MPAMMGVAMAGEPSDAATQIHQVAAPKQTPQELQPLLTRLRLDHPGTEFTGLVPSEIPGIAEVWMGANMAYVALSSPRYFLMGRLLDTETMTDLTGPKLALAARAVSESKVSPSIDARNASANADARRPGTLNGPDLRDLRDLHHLPVADAIQTVHGTGARQLLVFSDPACGFCKRLEPELADLKDVTIWNFIVPLLGQELPQAIWCAPDRAQAWSAWMLRGDRSMLNASTSILDAKACDAPLQRNAQLATRLGIQGTPTLVDATGQRHIGYRSSVEMERILQQAQSRLQTQGLPSASHNGAVDAPNPKTSSAGNHRSAPTRDTRNTQVASPSRQE